jgi:hypothetical protein
MIFLKYFHYAYLIFAILFFWDAFSSWETRGVASLLLGGTALFMFFFRKKFNKNRFDK